MQLEALITDRHGEPLTRLLQFVDLSVEEAINDATRARLTISIWDHACSYISPGDTMLKVQYEGILIFWGIIMIPTTRFGGEIVEVNAMCPGALAAMRNYLRWGDVAVDYGYTLDGKGMRVLMEACAPSVEQQIDQGVLPAGYILGNNDTTSAHDKEVAAGLEAGDLRRKAKRGTNVWEAVTNMSQVVGGPDFRFRPFDTGFAGYYVKFDTFDSIGQDRTEEVVFQHNFGLLNAADIEHSPDFAAVRNYFVQVNPGGPRSRGDANKGTARDLASWQKYGIMQGWESSGQKDTKKVLKAKASAWVQNYSAPPEYFTVTPGADESIGATDAIEVPFVLPILYRDYGLGDIITVQAKKGYREIDVQGRIVGHRVEQFGAEGDTRAVLTCVPNINTTLTEGEVG